MFESRKIVYVTDKICKSHIIFYWKALKYIFEMIAFASMDITKKRL